MSDDRTKKSYEDVSDYAIAPDMLEVLFDKQTECALIWSTSDGWPVGVMHRYMWANERFWITCAKPRLRVPALRARMPATTSASSFCPLPETPHTPRISWAWR